MEHEPTKTGLLYLKKPKDILTGSVVFEAGKDVKFEKTIVNSIDLEKAHTVDELKKRLCR